MKTFRQFITEATDTPDREGLGHGTGLSHRAGEKIGSERKKTEVEKRRTRAIGGGKSVPARTYKPRKDIGVQRSQSKTVQQPQKERGTAGVTGKEAQKKAYLERKARERGEKTKTASQLLSKKTTTVDPNYKPVKTSGLTTKERKALYKKGERVLRDITLKNLGKTKESELKHRITSK